MISWIRSRLLTGFFVSIPLFISVFALVWIFGIIDGLTAPLAAKLLGHGEPTGAMRLLVSAAGFFGTVALVLAVGVVATNVLGRRLLNRGEQWLLKIPVFRTI